MGEHDFEVLYRDEPGYIRSNANLPGRFVYPLARLTSHADYLDRIRTALEDLNPGKGDTWDWHLYGVEGKTNPVQDFIKPYSQFSRAEGMKGSEQVVRGFAGVNPEEMEGVGQEPNLTPSSRAGTATIVIQNGVKEVQKARRFGLGGLIR